METVVMKIAFVTTAFTPQMSGYAGMALPKAMAALGDTEVHVISPNLNVYHSIPDYSLIYERFLGPAETLCGTQLLNGFTLHRLPHWKVKDQVYIRGLGRVLHALKPDVVQAWIPNGPVSMQLAMLKPFLGFRFFTGQHTTKSVFPLAYYTRAPDFAGFRWMLCCNKRLWRNSSSLHGRSKTKVFYP
jgi:hypothetical protein